MQEVRISVVAWIIAVSDSRQPFGFGSKYPDVKHIGWWINIGSCAKNRARHCRDRVGIGADRVRGNAHRFRWPRFAPSQPCGSQRRQYTAGLVLRDRGASNASTMDR